MPQGRAGAARTPYASLERSYGRKIADLFAFLLPFLLLAGLALGGGGYDVLARHLAGILSWILVAVLLLGRWPDRIRPGRSLALVGGLILALALLSAVSSIWSSSVPSSLAEFERGIAYLGIFTASYLTMRTPKQREWFARGVAAGLAAVILLALGDRLIPGGETGAGVGLDRLSYPLGYWNADGIAFSSALILFTWFAATARRAPWRAVSITFAILAATGLYLTYSRGGILVTTVAIILLFFLTPSRLRVLTTFGVVLAGAAPILLISVNHFPAISGEASGDPSAGETLTVLLILAGFVTAAWLALEGMLRLSRSKPEAARKALAVSRDRRTLYSIAGAGVAALLILFLAFGNNVWDQFTDSDVPVAVDGQSRFTDLSSAWRYEFNQVALETFSDNPVLGSGAGTYPIEWTLRRDVPVVTQEGHSFYLENLAELGVPGGLLALSLPLALIWLGAIAWRRRLGAESPVVLALVSALFVSLFFDWFWELGFTAALLLLLAAWIASAEAVAPERQREQSGSGFRVAGLLASWVAIVVLAVPMAADHYNRASADSVRSGDIDRAVDQAENAKQLEPWAAEPHMQLGTIAESRGQFALALAEYNRAIELEPENWRALLLRIGLNVDLNRNREARADLERASRINPIYFGEVSFEELREQAS